MNIWNQNRKSKSQMMLLKHRFIFLITIILIFLSACSNRPKGVMSKSEMRTFLTDLHLLEGTLTTRYELNDREKAYYYQVLFEKHHVTKAEFDSSIVYYTKNPKVFERIYSKVNKNLDNLKMDVESGKYLPVIPDSIKFKPENINIWTRNIAFKYPKDTVKNNLTFTIIDNQLLTKDLYTFSYRMIAYTKDSLQTAYTTLRIHYADGVVDSLWHDVKTDSVMRRYKFMFNASRNYSIDSLTGTFYSYQNKLDSLKSDSLNINSSSLDSLNIRIDSISLFRKYIPFLRDSLKLKLDTVPVITIDKDSIRIEETILKFNKLSVSEKKEIRLTW